MNDQNGRYARLRYTATGALAALAVVGAIAGTAAVAAKPRAKTHGHAAVANGGATKTPTPPMPGKTHASQPAVNHQPFLTAVQRLVNDGTITTTEGQVRRSRDSGRQGRYRRRSRPAGSPRPSSRRSNRRSRTRSAHSDAQGDRRPVAPRDRPTLRRA